LQIHKKMRRFREDFTTLVNGESQIDANRCNSITIENTGTSTVKIFGRTLNPGDSYISNGNQDEINETQYKLQYTTAGTNELTVIRKFFI